MLGYSFQRQKPIYKYIVDFYCPKLQLILEIDGESHREQFHRDQVREEDLLRLGLHVLRFQDRDVKNDMRNVLNCIQNWIEQQEKKVVVVKSTRMRHSPTPPEAVNKSNGRHGGLFFDRFFLKTGQQTASFGCFRS